MLKPSWSNHSKEEEEEEEELRLVRHNIYNNSNIALFKLLLKEKGPILYENII
jgi:hypothetical protein